MRLSQNEPHVAPAFTVQISSRIGSVCDPMIGKTTAKVPPRPRPALSLHFNQIPSIPFFWFLPTGKKWRGGSSSSYLRPIRAVPEDVWGVAASVPRYILTEGIGRGQSRWFRVGACLCSVPPIGVALSRAFGVPGQNENLTVRG